ncbi:sugar transferase [Rufibacter glacialis]|uniref:Sugar transferase n=1 Tax=Rufibacter glacialis TaxID=1259555 RepID=A0A5M8QL24_9BACT|nr:sugar transferase [Rufibacter glacialis]KAA6435466.1 sugar transferase [Rufibacter glacialis]GGK63670.1 sugar transferase [Rufibacter glacialis]
MPYLPYGKRFLDLLLATSALLLLWPVMLLVAAVLWLGFGGHVLFRQQRPGLHGKPFTFCKFVTMTQARDQHGQLLPDAQRLTPLGKFIRKTSLDELPQLLHVLRGQMSVVGPRPLLMEYLPLYTPEQARRHQVKPGITGWAQVNGRNLLRWEEKFRYDLWYVEHVSLRVDALILWRTVKHLFRPEGISAPGTATMERFTGSSNTSSS